MQNSVSVVIPAYNEEKNVALCLTKVAAVLKKLPLESEIILVNDGSSDATGKIAKSFIGKIPHLKVIENKPNLGYGGALKAGFAKATKNLIAFFPADNQFNFSQITNLLFKMEETDADVVSGIRANRQDPFHRLFIGWGWNTLVRALFGSLASDVDCGFKLFRRSVLKRVSLPSNGAMIDTQLFAGVRARGLKVAEIEVDHFPRTAGYSTGANPKVILKALRELIIFWWQLRQEILVEQGRAVFRWEAILILIIILIAAFVRLHKIDQYMTFLGDEGRDVTVVRDLLTGKNLPFIGPGTSIGNMYLGPLYYYLMAVPLLIFNFSPVGPAVMIALFGVATIALVWWIGRQWFGRVSALTISLLYSLSSTVITHSHSSWNPNIMPFFALLSLYGIWKVWRFGYWRWLIISAICFAFVLNSHYLGLLLLPPIVLFWLFAKKSQNYIRYSLISIFSFLILMSPLLIFDINPNHNWMNARNIAKFFGERQTTVNLKAYKAIPNLWPIWTDINTSLLAAKDKKLGQITTIILTATTVFLLVRKPSKDLWFTITWVLVGLVGLGLYKQQIYDHYFGFLFPAPFFLLGFTLHHIPRNFIIKVIAISFLLLLLTINLKNNPLRFPPNYQLQRTKQVVKVIQTESRNQPFNLALIAKRNYDPSYVYFLNSSPYYTINQKATDQLFVICEDSDCQPLGHPLWEIAAFGWAKIDRQWEFPWGVKLFRLVHL